MNKSESISALAEALAKAQGEFKPALKHSENPHLHSKFADLGDLIEAVRPALTAHGLSFLQFPHNRDNQIELETVLLHQSGEWMSHTLTLPYLAENRAVNAAQAAGIVITYLRRYCLASVLGIYADEDTDGETEKQPTPRYGFRVRVHD